MRIRCGSWRHAISAGWIVGLLLLPSGLRGVPAADLVISVDRTAQDWSDLAMGGPASDDDADQSRTPGVVVRWISCLADPIWLRACPAPNCARFGASSTSAPGRGCSHS